VWSVHELQFLLLTKLDLILRFTDSPTAVLTRWIGPTVVVLSLVLIEELPSASADLGPRSGITSHLTTLPLLRATSVEWDRSHVLDSSDLDAHVLKCSNRSLAP